MAEVDNSLVIHGSFGSAGVDSLEQYPSPAILFRECTESYHNLLVQLSSDPASPSWHGLEQLFEEYSRLRIWGVERRVQLASTDPESLTSILENQPGLKRIITKILAQIRSSIAQVETATRRNSEGALSLYDVDSDGDSDETEDSDEDGSPRPLPMSRIISFVSENIKELYRLGNILRRPQLLGSLHPPPPSHDTNVPSARRYPTVRPGGIEVEVKDRRPQASVRRSHTRRFSSHDLRTSDTIFERDRGVERNLREAHYMDYLQNRIDQQNERINNRPICPPSPPTGIIHPYNRPTVTVTVPRPSNTSTESAGESEEYDNQSAAHQRNGLYINGVRVADINRRPSRRERQRPHVVVVDPPTIAPSPGPRRYHMVQSTSPPENRTIQRPRVNIVDPPTIPPSPGPPRYHTVESTPPPEDRATQRPYFFEAIPPGRPFPRGVALSTSPSEQRIRRHASRSHDIPLREYAKGGQPLPTAEQESQGSDGAESVAGRLQHLRIAEEKSREEEAEE